MYYCLLLPKGDYVSPWARGKQSLFLEDASKSICLEWLILLKRSGRGEHYFYIKTSADICYGIACKIPRNLWDKSGDFKDVSHLWLSTWASPAPWGCVGNEFILSNHLVLRCKSLRSTHWNGGLPEGRTFVSLLVSSRPVQSKPQTGGAPEPFVSSFHPPIGPLVLVKEQAAKVALKWCKEFSFLRIQTALGWILTLSLISCAITSLSLCFKMRIEIRIWFVVGTKCGSGYKSAL